MVASLHCRRQRHISLGHYFVKDGFGGCKGKAGEEIGTLLSNKPHHRPMASSICIKIVFLVQTITEREAKKGRHATSSQSPTSLTSTDLPVGHNGQWTRIQKQPAWETQRRKRTPAVRKDPLPRILLPLSHLHPAQGQRCTSSLMTVRAEDPTEPGRRCDQATAQGLLRVGLGVNECRPQAEKTYVMGRENHCWLLYTQKN